MEEIIEKLTRVFGERFPGSVAELERTAFAERVGGSLIWSGFEAVEQIDRQRQISRAVREGLAPEEQLKVSAILTFTPDEVAVMRED
jgi:hypothetical protein